MHFFHLDLFQSLFLCFTMCIVVQRHAQTYEGCMLNYFFNNEMCK